MSLHYPLEKPKLTSIQISDRLQAAIVMLTQIHNEHALERATMARLLEESRAEVARLTAQNIELLNLTADNKSCSQ